MSEQSIFSKLTLTTSSLFLSSLFLIGLCLSSLIISEKENKLLPDDNSAVQSINICNGIIGFMSIVIIIFSMYLLNPNNINDYTKYIFGTIGLCLLVLSITQFVFISKLSENFDNSSKKSLNICASLVLSVGMIFIIYGVYLYIKGYKPPSAPAPAPAPVPSSGDVLGDLEKALVKANENTEKALKAYGPKDIRYVEAKKTANAIKDDIDLFASEHNANIKRSKDVKEKTDLVRGINQKEEKAQGLFGR